MRRIQQLEAPHDERREEAERVFEKPIFTQILTGPSELWEGQNAHFEARVVPVGDPTLRFEWYVNGIELKLGKQSYYSTFIIIIIMTCCCLVTARSKLPLTTLLKRQSLSVFPKTVT